ncbi:thiolase family protein [Caballeronia sp. GAFFF2]|uniref:thiolase family protein n=1 Tax=Caballeronia sp. GAFFF2 TaxID=2921741 RepID=UPI002027C961|nr:thiolase family protein [Caballeronia sp. GAFFF2]
MFKDEIVLCAPVRTPIGAFGGSLKEVAATELGATAIRESVRRAGLAPRKVDAVIMGNVIQAGSGMNPARQASINGGIPVASPAVTVNRVCGSGAQAIASAAQEIALDISNVVIAGGMENMDRAPYLLPAARWGQRMGAAQVIDSMLRDGLDDAFSGRHSGWHTEDLVSKYGIGREAQDRWAERSQRRFSDARDAGHFANELVTVDVHGKKGVSPFDTDEQPRPDTNLETLARLKPAFRKDGTITAGNAPGLNSGASAMIVTRRATAESLDVVASARLVAFAVSAVEPGLFGIAPAPAVTKVLERAGWKLGDVERFEINEAFAAVPLAVIAELGIPEDIVNVDGGAIAHGHAIGATGAVLTTRLIHSMRRDGVRRGIVTLCIGGGQGIALALESV